MITFIYAKKKHIIHAESYNELSQRQLLEISDVFVKQLPRDIAEISILHILLGYDKIAFFRLPLDLKAAMIKEIEWVFTGMNLLTNNLLPEYDGLYGPASDWDNLTLAEWNACEIFFNRLVSEKDESAIDFLVSALYRPAKNEYDFEQNPDGDCREPFNPNLLEYRAKQIATWPANIKFAIVQWYSSCQGCVASYDLPTKEGATENEAADMFEMIRGLAGEKYGTYHEVEKLNVHHALRELEAMGKEAEEVKKQMEAQSNG